MKTRPVEMYRLWSEGGDSGSWDTCVYDIPIDTPEHRIEEVARNIAFSLIHEPCVTVGLYNLPELVEWRQALEESIRDAIADVWNVDEADQIVAGIASSLAETLPEEDSDTIMAYAMEYVSLLRPTPEGYYPE